MLVQAICCLQFIEPTCWIKGSWYGEGAHVSARASGHFLIGVSLVLLFSATVIALGCHELSSPLAPPSFHVPPPPPPPPPTPHAFLPTSTSPSSIEENGSFSRGDIFVYGCNKDNEDHVAGSLSVIYILMICYLLPCLLVGSCWLLVGAWLAERKESFSTADFYTFNSTGPLSCSDIELGGVAPVPNPPMQPPPNDTYPTPHPNRTSDAILK